MSNKILIIFGLFIFIKICQSVEDRGIGPVFIWHGLSECDEAESTQRMKKVFESQGALVKTVRIGGSCFMDTLSSYAPIPYQLAAVCTKLSNDPDLANGFTILGMSQGGLLSRALVQTCPTINVTTLITAGGPHTGTFGLPLCEALTSTLLMFFCYSARFLQAVINQGPTGLTPITNMIADYSAPPSFWIDPLRQPPNFENYVNIINNLISPDTLFKTNLLRLQKFIAIYFIPDGAIHPSTSARFDTYVPGTTNATIPYNQTYAYKNDLIGLKTLDETGRFIPVQFNGLHMTYSNEWFLENIIERYLIGQQNK